MLGLLSVITLGGGDVFKGYLSMTLGLFVGTMGVDLFTGTNRYTFGIMYMVDGVSLVALLAGLYAISETFNMVIGDLKKRYVTDTKNLRVSISLREYLNIKWTVLSSSLLGSLFGMVPGLGGGTASFLVYNFAKQRSKYPETFGKGNVHGIAAPEAANNAVVGGSLIPLLTLGIPGSPTCAVIASALIMQGIQPGPQVFGANPDLVYGIFWGLLLATIMMIVFGRYTTSIWAYLLVCPNYILVPIIVVASLIGAYSVRGFFIDVWIAIGVGIIAFFLRKIDFNMAAFILAFILAPLIEKSFRRSLMISRGSFVIFFNRPVAIILLVLIVAMIFFSIRKRMSAQTNKNKKELNFDV
jgi:putative tricarboxylic transport membrane protein